MALWRVVVGEDVRLARGPADEGPVELLAHVETLGDLLGGEPGGLDAALNGPGDGSVPADHQILVPLDQQEVWAAGVTYARSRDARMEESSTPDPYDRVYDADRPELFFKAAPGRARGTGQPVGIRADSGWDVPEPELGVVADHAGRVAGYLLGNDVSSRSIEGENPLYLPQAKTYTGSCAVGPCVVPSSGIEDPRSLSLSLHVRRAGRLLFEETVRISQMRRTIPELLSWLYRANTFPRGVVLLTGTPLVPDPAFTLRAGDDIEISAPALGTLSNPVELVGEAGRDMDAVAPRVDHSVGHRRKDG